MKSTVLSLLEKKGTDVWSIAPDATVFEALQIMADKGIGALVVKDGNSVVGIISERDYARKVILRGRTSKSSPVKDLMTKEVVYVRPDQSVDDCMVLMSEKHIRHLPVIDGDALQGLISIGDVVKAIIQDKEYMIENLVHYIRGDVA